MEHRISDLKQVRAFRLAIVAVVVALVFFLFTSVANAAIGETGREKDRKLADGVWESTLYVTESRSNNVRVHIVRINSGSNVSLKASNASYYKKGSTALKRKKASVNWGYATVEDQAKKYESIKDKEGTVVAGVNGDFYLKGDYNGQTEGLLVMEGNVINPSQKEAYFAVLKDGTYDMRDGTEDATDVQEAIAGYMWVVRDNKNNGKNAPMEWDTVTSLGLTSKGDVIIVCVDGRESSSAGMTVYDLGVLMKKQGCTDAILLDCGGSASFVTKRAGDKNLVLRNTSNDGMTRPVSSALLVVKNTKAGSAPKTNKAALSMKTSNTKITKKNGYYYYKAAGKKISGFRIVNDEQYLFNSKGKGLTKTIKIGDTAYYYKKGKLSKTTDKKAGKIAIGFCGASKNGQNLIYAYHYGDHKLNIGLNPFVKNNSGKMEDWTNVKFVPWMSEIRYIKEVNISKGVKNLGGCAFYISQNPFNDKAKKLGSELTGVTMPSTITTIGKYAIFNNDKLKAITIPKNVKTIKKYALAYNEKAQYTFIGKTPPTFASNVFTTSGKKTVLKVPAEKKWKSLLKSSKSKKKIGFKGKVKYKN